MLLLLKLELLLLLGQDPISLVDEALELKSVERLLVLKLRVGVSGFDLVLLGVEGGRRRWIGFHVRDLVGESLDILQRRGRGVGRKVKKSAIG